MNRTILDLNGVDRTATGVTSVNGRYGSVTIGSADVTGALGFTPYSAANPSGYISANQTITLSGDASGSGATGITVTLASVGTAGTYQSVTTDAKGRVTAGGSLSSSNVTTALGFTPVNAAGGTLSAGTLAGASTNTGTLTGGTLFPAVLLAGNTTVDVTVTNTTDTGGNALITYAVGGSTSGQIAQRITVKSGYVQLSDSALTAPNLAGAEAIDLQLDRNAGTQVASGNRAYAIGAQNTASGTRAGALGYGCTASGQGSIVMGQSATDNGVAATHAFSGGYLGQAITQQIGGISGAGTAIRLTSDGNAAGAANVMNLPTNTLTGMLLMVIARNVANGDMAMWQQTLCYGRGGTATINLLSPGTLAMLPDFFNPTLATATLTVAADSTNSGVNITVTPPAGVTVHCAAAPVGAQVS